MANNKMLSSIALFSLHYSISTIASFKTLSVAGQVTAVRIL